MSRSELFPPLTTTDIGLLSRAFRRSWWGHRTLIAVGTLSIFTVINFPAIATAFSPGMMTLAFFTFLAPIFAATTLMGLGAWYDMRRIHFSSSQMFAIFWCAFAGGVLFSILNARELLDMVRDISRPDVDASYLLQTIAARVVLVTAILIFAAVNIHHLLKIHRQMITLPDVDSVVSLSGLERHQMRRPLFAHALSASTFHLINVSVTALFIFVLAKLGQLLEPFFGVPFSPPSYFSMIYYDFSLIDALNWIYFVIENPAYQAISFVYSLLAIALGVWVFRIGLRIVRRLTSDLWRRAGAAPILLLRSFADDARMLRPTSVVRRMTRQRFRLEEALARELSSDGPLISVGNPGEALPQLGAYRMYFEGDTWQAEVLRLMRQVRLIVMVAGATPWVQWELRQAVAREYAEKLILVFPPSSAADKLERARPLIEALELDLSQIGLIETAAEQLRLISVLPNNRLALFVGGDSTQEDYQLATRLAVFQKELASGRVRAPAVHNAARLAAWKARAIGQKSRARAEIWGFHGRAWRGGWAVLFGLAGIIIPAYQMSWMRDIHIRSLGTTWTCDELANEFRTTSPMRTKLFSVDSAVVACRKALAQQPANPAYQAVLGRALIIKGEDAEGFRHLRAAAQQGYSPAMLWLASSLFGKAVPRVHSDQIAEDEAGLEWFLRAAQAGHPDSFFGLSLALSDPYLPEDPLGYLTAATYLISLHKRSEHASAATWAFSSDYLTAGVLSYGYGDFPDPMRRAVEQILGDLGFFQQMPDGSWSHATYQAIARFRASDTAIDPWNLCFATQGVKRCYNPPFAKVHNTVEDAIAHFRNSRLRAILLGMNYYKSALEAERTAAPPRVDDVPPASKIRGLQIVQQAIGYLHRRFADRPKAISVTDCDRKAGHPYDPHRVFRGVFYKDINPDSAIEACNAAISQYSNVPRYYYQRGRAFLEAARRVTGEARLQYYNKAVADFEYAMGKGYPSSFDIAGAMYSDGMGVDSDEKKAAKLSVQSFNRVIHCCGARVVEHLLDNQDIYNRESVRKAARTLLKWGVRLGDGKAATLVEKHFYGQSLSEHSMADNVDFSAIPPWILK